jgi:hypothetical protein
MVYLLELNVDWSLVGKYKGGWWFLDVKKPCLEKKKDGK